MKLFEYAIIHNPPKDSDARPSMIVEITNVLAADDKQATLLAARQIPETFLDRLDEVELVVRPF